MPVTVTTTDNKRVRLDYVKKVRGWQPVTMSFYGTNNNPIYKTVSLGKCDVDGECFAVYRKTSVGQYIHFCKGETVK